MLRTYDLRSSAGINIYAEYHTSKTQTLLYVRIIHTTLNCMAILENDEIDLHAYS